MHHLKSLATLAALAAAASAHAQSSVTLYGRLASTVSHVKVDGATQFSVTQMLPSAAESSMMGFRGTEDLGGGWHALFNLEGNVATDTGAAGSTAAASGTNTVTGSHFNRQSWVGLRSGFGTIRFGRSTTATILTHVTSNALISGYNSGLVTALTSQGLNNDFYHSNMVRFDSSRFGGFSVHANYALGEVQPGGKGGNAMGMAVNYRNGGVALSAATQRDKDQTGRHVQWNAIAGSYEFGEFELTAGANRVKVPAGLQSAATTAFVDSQLTTVGARYSVSPSFGIAAQGYRVKHTASGTASTQLVLNADYKLSKRTSLFALVSKVNARTMAIAAISGGPSAANADITGFGVGLNHTF